METLGRPDDGDHVARHRLADGDEIDERAEAAVDREAVIEPNETEDAAGRQKVPGVPAQMRY